MRYFGLDKKSEIRKIILTEVEDDVVGPRNGSDEIISENPTTMYLSGVLFPKETNVETDVKSDVLYLRYDENNLKYLYLCSICDTTWKTNNI